MSGYSRASSAGRHQKSLTLDPPSGNSTFLPDYKNTSMLPTVVGLKFWLVYKTTSRLQAGERVEIQHFRV